MKKCKYENILVSLNTFYCLPNSLQLITGSHYEKHIHILARQRLTNLTKMAALMLHVIPLYGSCLFGRVVQHLTHIPVTDQSCCDQDLLRFDKG